MHLFARVTTLYLHRTFLFKDEVPIQYWKELAEQRRIALEKALQENEEVSVLVWFALICCRHSHNTFLVFLSAPRASRTAHRREQAPSNNRRSSSPIGRAREGKHAFFALVQPAAVSVVLPQLSFFLVLLCYESLSK